MTRKTTTATAPGFTFQQLATMQCPAWCMSHQLVDEGHAEEHVTHRSSDAEIAGFTMYVTRDEYASAKFPNESAIWCNDEMLTARNAHGIAATLAALTGLLDEER